MHFIASYRRGETSAPLGHPRGLIHPLPLNSITFWKNPNFSMILSLMIVTLYIWDSKNLLKGFMDVQQQTILRQSSDCTLIISVLDLIILIGSILSVTIGASEGMITTSTMKLDRG